MNKTKSIFKLAISIALVFTFSCGNNGGNSYDNDSQVYTKKNIPYLGSGDIKIGTIIVGSVTKGIVKLDLSKTKIPDEHLEQLYCDDYPTSIKVLIVNYFNLFYTNSNEELLGRLRIEYIDEQEQIWERISYLYSSKDEKITCNKINSDIKAGWNKMYVRQTRNLEEWSTDNILTKEVKWIIR